MFLFNAIVCVGTVSGIVAYTHFKMAEQREEKKRREQEQGQEKQFQPKSHMSESQELLVSIDSSEDKAENS